MELIKLNSNEVQIVGITKIQGMITGTIRCEISQEDRKGKRLVKLVYEDNTTETGILSSKEILEIEHYFSLVSKVQSQRIVCKRCGCRIDDGRYCEDCEDDMPDLEDKFDQLLKEF